MKSIQTEEVVKLASNIAFKLNQLGVDKDGKDNGVGADLADIYEAASRYQELLAEWLSIPTEEKEKLAKNLVMLQMELYQHLSWHLRELKHPLEKLIKALYTKKTKE